ncbi:uncharacterized protein LOC126824779 [Patella vulgata]|uniref:uncharacterized protein LOC126824779 n=1 Tax=Patella vulgata TaxID=6465 RepID=UPI00217F8AB8|nr:uncharacterized protein LOC126824779 [Patella vulgata]XP_050410115.1 uncharacterized protein LOC126824779 [Patella vulgata]XP_050410116.1 uncharacterized protein LOC126824779 [Patella vulgata]
MITPNYGLYVDSNISSEVDELDDDIPDNVESEITMSTQYLVLAISIGIYSVLGTAGNLPVLVVYFRKRDKKAANTFIRVLAVIDLVVSAMIMPYTLIYELHMVQSDIICRGVEFLRHFTIIASNMTLVAIAVERYCAVCRLSQRFSVQNVNQGMLVMLTVSLILAFPSIGIFAVVPTSTVQDINCSFPHVSNDTMVCHFTTAIVGETVAYIYQSVLMLSFFITLIMIVIFYSIVYSVLWKRAKLRRARMKYIGSDYAERSQASSETFESSIYTAPSQNSKQSSAPSQNSKQSSAPSQNSKQSSALSQNSKQSSALSQNSKQSSAFSRNSKQSSALSQNSKQSSNKTKPPGVTKVPKRDMKATKDLKNRRHNAPAHRNEKSENGKNRDREVKIKPEKSKTKKEQTKVKTKEVKNKGLKSTSESGDLKTVSKDIKIGSEDSKSEPKDLITVTVDLEHVLEDLETAVDGFQNKCDDLNNGPEVIYTNPDDVKAKLGLDHANSQISKTELKAHNNKSMDWKNEPENLRSIYGDLKTISGDLKMKYAGSESSTTTGSDQSLPSTSTEHTVSDDVQISVNSTTTLTRTRHRNLHHRTAKMLFLCTVIYVVSWMPFWFDIFGATRNVVLRYMFFLGNATNPLIYGIVNEHVRKACLGLIYECKLKVNMLCNNNKNSHHSKSKNAHRHKSRK